MAFWFGRALAVVAGLFSIGQAYAAVPPLLVTMKNNSGVADSQVYIGFVGNSSLSATNVATGQPVLASQYNSPHWYTLDQVRQGINVTGFSGRIYVGYGSPWTFPSAGYEPSPTNPNDPNYLKRYDKMELTYHGNAADVANASTIDYFSIPMTLRVYKGGTAGTLKGTIRASDTATTLNAVRTVTPTPNAAVVNDANGDFVRAIGPGVYPPAGGLPASPYSNFDTYLSYLKDNYAPSHGNVVARIKGYFGGVGPAPTTPQTKGQNYDFTVAINANRDLVLTGTGTQVGTHTIVYKYADLTNPTGIYGANPSFYFDSATTASNPQNDLYGWMAGDLLAGLNIGAVGSTVVRNGVQVGTMDSSQWFGLTNLFAGLQPNAPYYNTWAAALSPISDAYNFAYSDRFAPVTATLDPNAVDTLEIDLRPAGVPEPTGLLLPAGAAAALLRRKRD